MPKQCNVRKEKEPPKIPLRLSCVDHLLLSLKPTLKCGLCTQWDATGEN